MVTSVIRHQYFPRTSLKLLGQFELNFICSFMGIRDKTDHGQNGPWTKRTTVRTKRTMLRTKRTTFKDKTDHDQDKTDHALGRNGPRYYSYWTMIYKNKCNLKLHKRPFIVLGGIFHLICNVCSERFLSLENI